MPLAPEFMYHGTMPWRRAVELVRGLRWSPLFVDCQSEVMAVVDDGLSAKLHLCNGVIRVTLFAEPRLYVRLWIEDEKDRRETLLVSVPIDGRADLGFCDSWVPSLVAPIYPVERVVVGWQARTDAKQMQQARRYAVGKLAAALAAELSV